MITKTNFKDLLQTLGFTAEENTFQKSIGEADLKVDCDKQRIIYPEDRGLIVNERQTCNFSQDENFVVFECVHRLLEQGYKPEHLELEPRWKVGHGASGGRADILVKDRENKPWLIIECKTAGDEFEKAWAKTHQDGDQLFSYAQQISEIQYLCLYASSFIETELHFNHEIIPHRDNPEILAEDPTLPSFAKATNVRERFAVWHDTYKSATQKVGIFGHNIQPYQIGKNNYTLAEDTKPIDATDKEGKYHQFRTILRKHNIARRENAFEVLVNLFLCKLVDEEENKTDLKFYWNGPASDNYFDFVDRLQNLYRKGMRKFLNAEISYISNEEIDSAFWTVKNKRNATKKQIQRYFRELKFFTNSAFSFLDTHNEGLFNKNTEVLLEVVEMWQKLRLKTDSPNPFLGHMFEFFLDDGIKQSEGQFFTPLPICKFIVASLPLAQKIETSPEPIKAIDYACGSGHFLNEYADQIELLVKKQNRPVSDYYSQITGVEKEDRLAKVAKVAAYMHGQEQIKILDADALAAHPEIQRESFDLLVANPPFAVKGFLETVSDTDKEQYQLIQAIDKSKIHNNNDIECFFLERIHHLMAPDGVVGVIVPPTILSNTDAVRIRTRELLLQFFDLVSIAELGSGTFGKTGTNTVVLFLRRKAQRPEPAEHYRARVDDFFEGDAEGTEYQDDYLVKAYCNRIEVPYEEYIKLFAQTNLERLAELLQYGIFQDYKQAFNQSTEIKNLRKSNVFKKKTAPEQSAELEQRLIAYLHKIEKDKLYYFILAHEQAGRVLIVNTPSKKELEQFLGYDWSGAKGSEGIKYNGGETLNDIITPLFDPKDLDNDTKINTAIKRNFIGEITDELPDHCQYAKLTDMLDFSRIDFNKAISLNPKQNAIVISSSYEMEKLENLMTIVRGASPRPIKKYLTNDRAGINWIKIGDVKAEDKYITKTQEKITKEGAEKSRYVNPNDFILSNSMSFGRPYILKISGCVHDGWLILQSIDQKLNKDFLHLVLSSENVQSEFRNKAEGGVVENLNIDRVKSVKIPVPPLEVQQQIADECEAVDQETDQARQTITAAKQKIEGKVQSVINAGYEAKNIDRVLTLEYGISLPEKERISGDFPVYGSNGVVGSHNEFLVKAPCIIVGRKGSAGEINWSDKNCTPIDTTFYVKLLDETTTDLKFTYHMLKSLNLPSLKVGSGPGGINRNNVYGLQIPIPPLNVQQQLVVEVEQLETKITEAQAIIDNATARKNDILTKYL